MSKLYFTYLPKTGGARMRDVHTVKLCKENKLLGYQSIKAAEETGLEEDEFVHVILSRLKDHDFPVIVKIHDENSIYTKNELRYLKKMRDFENSVKMICHFSCMDHKPRWLSRVTNKSVKFCNNKNDRLHFFVLEYIENGDIVHFFQTTDSAKIMSFIIQTTLAIMIMGIDYNTCHGDLNSGNILAATTEKLRISYRVFDKEYRVKSFGIIPKFIDYGRSYKPSDNIAIMDQVFICLSILVNHISAASPLKQKIRDFLHYEENILHAQEDDAFDIDNDIVDEVDIDDKYFHYFIQKLRKIE